RVLDRRVDRSAGAMPCTCPAMQGRRDARLTVLELVAEERREKMMEAIPLASIVERHQEQVHTREVGEQLVRALLFEHRVAQRPTKLFEDRRPQHQGLTRWIVRVEDLVDEEVDNMAVLAPKLAHAGLSIVRAAERERG